MGRSPERPIYVYIGSTISCIMISARKVVLNCLPLMLAAAACPPASSVVMEVKTRNGKQMMCMQTGLVGGWEECGTQNYIAVFRGKVMKVVQVSEWELELSVTVEEVFKGDLTTTIEFGTSQGICFDDLNSESEWLFFLEKNKESGKPYLNYYSRNPSGPAVDRGEELARLRELKLLHGEGMIIGSVQRVSNNGRLIDRSPAPGYKVVARDARTGKKYQTTTDSKGKFELEPIPTGSFSLTPSKSSLFRSRYTIDVAPGGCSKIDLSADQ